MSRTAARWSFPALLACAVLCVITLGLATSDVDSDAGACGSVLSPAWADVGGTEAACNDVLGQRRIAVAVAGTAGAAALAWVLVSSRRRHASPT